MLPTWDPNRLIRRKPFNVALVGGRKMGKSTAQQDLIHRMKSEFDLVICFIGSAACNPCLEYLLNEHWDPRFFFSEWDENLIDKLLRQQEELLAAGKTREVLLLVDDVILNSKADHQLAHMGMRGRHFRISLMMCAVSYTSLPKRMRRSLDVLMVYSVPMRGDMQVLTYEYCQGRVNVARCCLQSLKDHECLVLETLQKKQQLFMWKADLLEVIDETDNRRSKSPDLSESKIEEHIENESARQPPSRQNKISDLSDDTESEGLP